MRAERRQGIIARFARSRGGGVAAIFALMAPVLIAFGVGMGVEIGIWYTVKRHMQTVVDQAAIAGALEFAVGPAGSPFANPVIYTAGTSPTWSQDVCDQAQATAKKNGFAPAPASVHCPTADLTGAPSCTGPTDTASSGMCVNVPPQLGSHQDTTHVEVIAWSPVSPISFFVPQVAVTTRAVAGTARLPAPCLLAFGYYPTPTTKDPIGFGGGGSAYGVSAGGATNIKIDCSVASYPPIPNSISINGVGGGSSIDVRALETAGQIVITNQANVYKYPGPTQTYDPAPQYPKEEKLPVDPFGCSGANVPIGNVAFLGCGITYTAPTSASCTDFSTVGNVLADGTRVLSPLPAGQYYCPMDVSGKVVLSPGVYVINGSASSGYGLQVEQNARLTSVDPTSGTLEPVTIILSGTSNANTQTSSGGVIFKASGTPLSSCPPNTGAPVSICLSAPPTDSTFPGIPAGLLIYQDPRFVMRGASAASGANKSNSSTSSSAAYMQGALYAPLSQISYSGGGGSGCTIAFAASINFSGGSQGLGNENCQPSLKPTVINARLVE